MTATKLYDPEVEVRGVLERAMNIDELKEDPALALKFTEIVMKMRVIERLGHELCLAIRYALFGLNASELSSILELGSYLENFKE